MLIRKPPTGRSLLPRKPAVCRAVVLSKSPWPCVDAPVIEESWSKKMKRLIPAALLIVSLLTACAPARKAVATEVALQRSQQTPMLTATVYPKATDYPTATAYPAQTARVVVVTSTVTPTQAPLPGVKEIVKCGDAFSIQVLQPAQQLTYIYDQTPNGIFLAAPLEITNTGSKSLPELRPEWFTLSAYLDGKILIFPYEWDASWGAAYQRNQTSLVYDYKYLNSEFLPGKPVKVMAVFDITPRTKGWILTFAPQFAAESAPACTAQIMLGEMP
jgi:hypothetical protein